MIINNEAMRLAEEIDTLVTQYADTDDGTAQLLYSVYDYMEGFKQIMDTTDRLQMDYLCNQYPGFYRFAQLLERMAEGIESGAIDVPKDN